jgi:two-component system nitrate/nitrite response regulator NarL
VVKGFLEGRSGADRRTRMRTIQVAVISDHILFRDALSNLLLSEFHFAVTGSYVATAQEMESLEPPDVVLLDSNLGEEQVNQFLWAFRAKGHAGRVLILTAGMTAIACSVALQLGAAGVFLKNNSASLLANVIRRVQSGEVWVDPGVIRLLADARHPREPDDSIHPLTQRQERVLQGIVDGLTNKEIGSLLGISESAVKATMQALFQKTSVRTRGQLVWIAMQAPGKIRRSAAAHVRTLPADAMARASVV